MASGGSGEKVRELLDGQDLASGKLSASGVSARAEGSCASGASASAHTKILSIAIPDEYVEHGNVDLLKKEIGIDEESVVKRIQEEWNRI